MRDSDIDSLSADGAQEADHSFIGSWVIRRKDLGTFTSLGERGKAHLVESEITDRLVMNCGRQLKLVTSRGTFGQFVARRLETRCLQCI